MTKAMFVYILAVFIYISI